MSYSTREITVTVPKRVDIVVCDSCQATADEQNFSTPANWAEVDILREGPTDTWPHKTQNLPTNLHLCPECIRRAVPGAF